MASIIVYLRAGDPMARGVHPGASLAGNESLPASSTGSMFASVSVASGGSSGVTSALAASASARCSGLLVTRPLGVFVMVIPPIRIDLHNHNYV
jgi:hypothetical protein